MSQARSKDGRGALDTPRVSGEQQPSKQLFDTTGGIVTMVSLWFGTSS